jgi:hypothetical protein
MTARDKELDDVRESLKEENDVTPTGAPYIHMPDERIVPTNGNCFKDQKRLCGPDCIAFGDPEAAVPMDRCQILGMQAGQFIMQERLVTSIDLLVKLLAKKEEKGPPGPPPPPNPFGS